MVTSEISPQPRRSQHLDSRPYSDGQVNQGRIGEQVRRILGLFPAQGCRVNLGALTLC